MLSRDALERAEAADRAERRDPLEAFALGVARHEPEQQPLGARGGAALQRRYEAGDLDVDQLRDPTSIGVGVLEVEVDELPRALDQVGEAGMRVDQAGLRQRLSQRVAAAPLRGEARERAGELVLGRVAQADVRALPFDPLDHEKRLRDRLRQRQREHRGHREPVRAPQLQQPGLGVAPLLRAEPGLAHQEAMAELAQRGGQPRALAAVELQHHLAAGDPSRHHLVSAVAARGARQQHALDSAHAHAAVLASAHPRPSSVPNRAAMRYLEDGFCARSRNARSSRRPARTNGLGSANANSWV